jgi:hypothetical protein
MEKHIVESSIMVHLIIKCAIILFWVAIYLELYSTKKKKKGTNYQIIPQLANPK